MRESPSGSDVISEIAEQGQGKGEIYSKLFPDALSLPEGRMENGAVDSRPGLIYFHGAQEEQRLPEKLLEGGMYIFST